VCRRCGHGRVRGSPACTACSPPSGVGVDTVLVTTVLRMVAAAERFSRFWTWYDCHVTFLRSPNSIGAGMGWPAALLAVVGCGCGTQVREHCQMYSV
jgi:hypothetical protein